MNARWLVVLLLAALALVAAGCGGDDDGDSASSDTAVVETDAPDDGEGTMDGSTETDTTETDAADDAEGALGGECAELAGLGAQVQNAFGNTTGDIDSVAEVLDELAERVPEEIRDDYQVLADNFKEFADVLKDVDLSSGATPDAETLAKLQEAASSMDAPEVREATANIEAWVKANC
jgi:hypothetical protein